MVTIRTLIQRLIVLSVFTLVLGCCLPDEGTGKFAKGVFGLLTLILVVEPLLEKL